MNARGADVYLRPAGEHSLILISGLQDEGLERMTREGLAPAATAEVSPGRYEAWLKLSDKALPESVLRGAQLGLAKRYGGTGSTDRQPFGRLAGLTNQDPQHAQESARGKLQPYVLAKDCNGQVAPAGPGFMQQIEHALQARAALHERERQARQEQERQRSRDRSQGRDGPSRGR